MGSAYRLHRRTCYTKKEPPRRISEVLKVAATSSPTTQCSTIGDAVSLCCPRPSPLRCLPPLPAPPLSALSRARAPQARTAHTPHGSLREHTAPHSATPPPMRHTYHSQNLPIPPDYIKDMVSFNKECAHARTYVYYIRSIGLSNKVFGNPHGCIYVSDGKTNIT